MFLSCKNNCRKIVLSAGAILFIAIFIFAMYIRNQYVVPVLMYHMVSGDKPDKNNRLVVSLKSFQQQMEFLKRNRYNVISLEVLVNLIREHKRIPYKTLVITFDDGYKNNFTQAFPIIREYNIPITIFVVANKIGKTIGQDEFMSWQDLKEMQESGLVTFGSHTLSDIYLPKVDDKDRLRKEIFDSKRVLEKGLGRPVSLFSYPVGGFNKEIRQMVIEAGYIGAVATNPGKKYPKDDIYALKRQRISSTSDNLFVFWIESSGFYTWLKELRDKD